MLFNSFPFLLVFLPAALILDRLACRFLPRQRLCLLVALSLVFYGYWDWRLLPLLVLSIGLNWLVSRAFAAWRRPALIVAAIAANLLVLAVFKYGAFLVGFADGIGHLGLPVPAIVLPLGISFFTFHHIMYLTDLGAGRAPLFGPTRYALYIGFFPQVLSGPLVRWSEVMQQFDAAAGGALPSADQIARGILLLVIGLMKKVLIADALTPLVDPVFAAAQAGDGVGTASAWLATLGFTFKIYFDFSGYTDMALGIALLFGIVLPPNFNAPYRATSLQDFWRRWHMTLSRFLRDYLYIPLGGNRHGPAVRAFALIATMALGGLWHGAGWTFVAWGLAHGIGLLAILAWRRLGWACPALLGWALTLLFVMLTWVLFRAESFGAALAVYRAMLGSAAAEAVRPSATLGLAALVAILGPRSATIAARLPQTPLVAAATAVVFVLLLLKIGDSESYQFIYFKF